jgi:hypothetical protein
MGGKEGLFVLGGNLGFLPPLPVIVLAALTTAAKYLLASVTYLAS